MVENQNKIEDQKSGLATAGTPGSGTSVENAQADIPPAPEKPKKEEETVTVPRATFERLLERVEEIAKDQEILHEAGDKSKIQRITELRAQGKLVKSVNISTIDGKMVVGWARVKDDVFFDEQGRLHETQIVKVIFEDKSEKELDYRAFSRLKIPMKAEVLKESKDSEGNYNLHVMLEDGQELDIDAKFVN